MWPWKLNHNKDSKPVSPIRDSHTVPVQTCTDTLGHETMFEEHETMLEEHCTDGGCAELRCVSYSRLFQDGKMYYVLH